MPERYLVDVGDWEPRDREGPEREHPPARIEYAPDCSWCGNMLSVAEEEQGSLCFACEDEAGGRF